jgi:hypothetical protein
VNCIDHRCVADAETPLCCELPGCKKGESCLMNDWETQSTCMSCSTDCDCPQGYMCAIDECILMSTPTYCCQKAGCPGGQDCTNLAGDSFNNCPGSLGKCLFACDCPQGQYCKAGKCEEDIMYESYCCDRFNCPEYKACFHVNGKSGTCPKQQQF